MNPVNQMRNRFTATIQSATQEIQNLKIIIADNTKEITRLQAQNVQMEHDLNEALTAVANKVSLLNRLKNLLGIQPNDHEQNLEEKITNLIDSRIRQEQRIANLQASLDQAITNQNEANRRLAAMEADQAARAAQVDPSNKAVMKGFAAGVLGTTGLGLIAYKITKVFAGVRAGAATGAAVGAAISVPGGPLMFVSTAPTGALVGGVIGGLVALVTP